MSDAKQRLLSVLRLRAVPFTLPAADGTVVFLRRWDTAERQEFQLIVRHQPDGKPLPNLYETLFVKSVCDADGTRLFGDDELTAASALDGLALEQIAKEVLRVNGLAGDDEKKVPSPTTPN